MTDLELIRQLVQNDEHLSEREQEAFWDMRGSLEAGAIQKLSLPQREWAESVHRKLELDVEQTLNLYSRGVVPPGRPVATPDVLQNLPKKPMIGLENVKVFNILRAR